MKARRFREVPRNTASKGHLQIYSLLKDIFPYHEIYQEYPYSKILALSYKHCKVDKRYQDSYLLKAGNRLFADIFNATYQFVIEVQGEQHYRPISWSNKEDLDAALKRFYTQKRTDGIKRSISKEACVKLIELSYKELKSVDKKFIMDLLKGTNNG